jgi:hypothetical protein
VITKPTVFILGAGASVPYQFPTARQLTQNICNNILSDLLREPYLREIESETGIRPKTFIEMAREIHDSGVPSIDLWLENRPEYIKAGKICIAREILTIENPHILGGWYADLWTTYLMPAANKGSKSIRDNQVSFVTFNYERSLEEFLIHKIKATYGISEADCAEELNKIPIIHAYGLVGRLPWQPESVSPTVRSYGGNQTWSQAAESAESIKILSEGRLNSPEFSLARDKIAAANRIVFLGFGYHEENLRRLKPPQGFLPNTEVCGSAFGLKDRDRVRFTGSANGFGTRITLGSEQWTVENFLENKIPA